MKNESEESDIILNCQYYVQAIILWMGIRIDNCLLLLFIIARSISESNPPINKIMFYKSIGLRVRTTCVRMLSSIWEM